MLGQHGIPGLVRAVHHRADAHPADRGATRDRGAVRRAHRDHRVELLDGDDKNDLRKLVPLYFLGAVIYGSAGAIYASSILQARPRFWFIVAGISMIAGVLLAAAYWKNPSRITGIGLILAQFAVLLSNAIARQWAQLSELIKWYDPYKLRSAANGVASRSS